MTSVAYGLVFIHMTPLRHMEGIGVVRGIRGAKGLLRNMKWHENRDQHPYLSTIELTLPSIFSFYHRLLPEMLSLRYLFLPPEPLGSPPHPHVTHRYT